MLVEAAERAAGDVDEERVECLAVALVGVEALVQERAQKPAGLRSAERVARTVR